MNGLNYFKSVLQRAGFLNFGKRISNQHGSMTMQVLALSALVVTIGAASMQMFYMNKKFSESEVQSADMNLLQSLIDSVMKNEDSCRVALGASSVWHGPLTGREQTYSPTQEITLYKSDGSTVLLNNTTNNVYGKLAISSIRFSNIRTIGTSGGSTYYFAQLNVVANKSSSLFGSASLTRSNVKVTLEVDGSGKIISCSSLTFVGTDKTNALALPICASDQSLYSNGGIIKCVKTICEAGKLPLNPATYDSGGNILCY